ncbi:TPA: DUF977 family protein [Klebsiella oxytoca]
MAMITENQRNGFIRKIIDETRKKGRLTVRDACEILGMNRDAVQRYFHMAAESGQVIRHKKSGLFPDYRATINFDLQRYTSKKGAK